MEAVHGVGYRKENEKKSDFCPQMPYPINNKTFTDRMSNSKTLGININKLGCLELIEVGSRKYR